MNDKIIETNLIGNASGLTDISPAKQQKTKDPSLFWGQKVKAEVEAHTKTNEYIAELQNILENSDKFIIENTPNKTYINFRDNGNYTGIEWHNNPDCNAPKDAYYIIYGQEYHPDDYGYKEIDKLFNKIKDKCDVE